MSDKDPVSDALIREVDEDLKREQVEKLWKAYGKYVISGAVALVLGVAGYEAYSSWKIRQAQDDSLRFATVASQAIRGRDEASLAGLDGLTKESQTVYGPLAQLRKAGILAARKDTDKAVQSLEGAAASSDLPALYREAARLQAVLLQLDTADPAKLAAQLDQLAAPGQPWRHSALELQALLALRTGDKAKALDIYTRLSDDVAAPQGLRARAAEARQAIDSQGQG
ncbi:MAG: tetratricopeptide repeat protein [Alphaproteobacteria bacterium]|nr:tetratricopeptide repeat protein [Alphaproteobacteria bacterium]